MFATSTYLENHPLLPFTDELYLTSFWKHPFITKSNNVKDWFLINKITELINECDNPHFDSIFPDDIEIINLFDTNYYDVKLPTGTFSFYICDDNEIEIDVIENIKSKITIIPPAMILHHIKIDKRVKATLYHHNEEIETRNQPEKAYDTINCCVCFEDYEDECIQFNEDNKTKKIASCGHTLCYGCWYHIIRSDNSICPHCRETWDEGYDIEENSDDYEDIYYDINDIQELCDNDEDDILNEIVNLPDLVRDVLFVDGYEIVLGFDTYDNYDWTLPPDKYRQLGGINGDIHILMSET